MWLPLACTFARSIYARSSFCCDTRPILTWPACTQSTPFLYHIFVSHFHQRSRDIQPSPWCAHQSRVASMAQLPFRNKTSWSNSFILRCSCCIKTICLSSSVCRLRHSEFSNASNAALHVNAMSAPRIAGGARSLVFGGVWFVSRPYICRDNVRYNYFLDKNPREVITIIWEMGYDGRKFQLCRDIGMPPRIYIFCGCTNVY